MIAGPCGPAFATGDTGIPYTMQLIFGACFLVVCRSAAASCDYCQDKKLFFSQKKWFFWLTKNACAFLRTNKSLCTHFPPSMSRPVVNRRVFSKYGKLRKNTEKYGKIRKNTEIFWPSKVRKFANPY